ncbi:transcriptional regulator, HxlR family [Soonwooa buanensis]|uniref:Transcriptional regulator, HxlR family n=1 Tax=Soonwooa buanensis TaxID=619805 RepID=A0A1T5CV58_9FLAO|nr:helix-turn-helix domain-containing protein [Soonwooa buanensis]SKB63342.1 transcriptional regulator, HxlR family [Soonwooa buanensis]
MKKQNSTNSINEEILQSFCKTHTILSQITGRWKVSIIFSLKENTKNYSELRLEIPNLTDRVLAKQLKELLSDEIVENKKTKTKSEYNLSKKGQKILQLLEYVKKLEL